MVVLELSDLFIVGYGIPIAEDPTQGGIIIYHSPSASILQHLQLNGRVTTLRFFQNSLWIGTNGGVYRLYNDFQQLTLYDQQKGLPTGRIVSGFAADENTLWCGMEMIETWDMDAPQSGGLGKYQSNNDTWEFYDDREGWLPGKWVSQIVLSHGQVLVETENGWTIFNQHKLPQDTVKTMEFSGNISKCNRNC